MKTKKIISAKKYFLYALPLAILYKVIAFFTIDRLFEGLYGRMIDFCIIVAILLFCLFKAKIPQE